jgi:hypothetical protein
MRICNHHIARISAKSLKMQQEGTNGQDVMIEMSLKNFRSIHEPRPTCTPIGQAPTLTLPPLPQLLTTNSDTSPGPTALAVSRSRERRSNTVVSRVQGAFNVKTEDMVSGGIKREKFKSLIDNHLKRQAGQFCFVCPDQTLINCH